MGRWVDGDGSYHLALPDDKEAIVKHDRPTNEHGDPGILEVKVDGVFGFFHTREHGISPFYGSSLEGSLRYYWIINSAEGLPMETQRYLSHAMEEIKRRVQGTL